MIPSQTCKLGHDVPIRSILIVSLFSAPPLISRPSHTGYLTTSSPLIKTSAVDEPEFNHVDEHVAEETRESVPQIQIPDIDSTAEPPSIVQSPTSPVLVDRADSLRIESDERGRRGSMSRLRDKSPARKLREVFSIKGHKSPRTSPERTMHEHFDGGVGNLMGKSASFSERRLHHYPDRVQPDPIHAGNGAATAERASMSMPALDTLDPPRTPPGSTTGTPVTTITPPTPTLPQPPGSPGSPRRATESTLHNNDSGITVSPSGNMISHRRTRSQSITKQPSKLSNSTLPPLTPTIEEVKTPPKDDDKVGAAKNFAPGGGFFSSWVSAAQVAATSLTNTLNTHTRTRSFGSQPEDAPSKASEETIREEQKDEKREAEIQKKQLAIETLGTGDLNFGHLGLDHSGDGKTSLARPDLEDLRKTSTIQRDEAAAKVEDMLAKRAVSAAYEAPSDSTPVAELPDPLQSLKHTQTGSSTLLGEQTPPNGSIFGDDTGSVKRSTSMRSRMQKRRSRGSSVATGASTIGAIVGASTATLANPATGPRLSGFAVAPKARNRAFHQSFRSVPEDDYLIEDYSCALQKEILLAGRIYISEGHICFSSNILGWVTTLVISFEEVVSIERETTAMVFPNAIAIQTLHARHTFRSLLSREATFDLMIGIWKVSHPASFKKSVNGKQWMEQEAAKQEETVKNALAVDADTKSEDDSDSGSDETDEEGSEGSVVSLADSPPSVAGSEHAEVKSLTSRPSGSNGAHSPPDAPHVAPEGSFGIAATNAETQDYPGPPTHTPTDCSDSATHYEKIVKDEIIPAPLGKIYSLLYGAQSGSFVRKYLLDEQKAQDLQMEDDKTGLSNDTKSRQYSYIKPLGGSIGPKQTKCITTEHLDASDLERAVSVTCTTQTPDVPSGSAFSVKTRYCLSWAPGNATRLQMNCGLEWTAKSWLKSPIEKGANDGQQSYGDGLVRALRAAVGGSPKKGMSRERGATGVSKGSRKKKRKSKKDGSEGKAEAKKGRSDWGLLEPVHAIFEPVVGLLGPLGSPWGIVTVLLLVMTISWFRTPARGSAVGFGQSSQRLVAYEEMWRREEADLWDWLEDRVGVESLRHGNLAGAAKRDVKKEAKERKKILGSSKDVERRLREEKMSGREMEEQLRVTRERLAVLERVMEGKRNQERRVKG